MELYKPYLLKNGEIIIFDSVSMYEDNRRMPIDIYTSKQYDGTWNKKGKYLTNIHFLNGEASELDVLK